MDLSRIGHRLEVRFGLGSNPELRRGLYRRIEKLVEAEGEEVYVLVSQVAADAVGKRDEGRYFAFSVIRRLREHGYMAGIDL